MRRHATTATSDHHNRATTPTTTKEKPAMRKRLYATAAAILIGAGILTTATHATATTGVTWCDDPAGGIAIIGDSLSTGYYPPTAPPSEVVQPSQTWFAKLANKEKIQRGATTNVIANNGAMASDYLAGGRWPTQVDQIGTWQPSLILIELGGNEYHSGLRTSTQYRTDLQNLYNRIHALSPRSTVGWVSMYQLQDNQIDNQPVIPAGQNTTEGNPSETWNAYVRQAFNAALVNLGPHFDLSNWYFPANWGDPDTFHQISSVDHIHPTPTGENDFFAVMDQGINRTCGWS